MGRQQIEDALPGLRGVAYKITSPFDPRYNCVAWAANDDRFWWQFVPNSQGYYWPPGIPAGDTLDIWVQVFQSQGYSRCENLAVEAGLEKLAIYAHEDGQPTHVSRQLPNGGWTSKLGKAEDIEHPSVECLEGDYYGTFARAMMRTRAES